MNGEETKSAGVKSQMQIEFTDKPISAWGGIASLVARYVERLGFREWVEKNLPIAEVSPNGKGRYEKVLALFLTVLTGGDRFSHMGWWGHGKEIMCRIFGVKWLPQSPPVMTRFWNKINSFEAAEIFGSKLRSLAIEIACWEGLKEDELRFDSSVVTRYGRQEGALKGYNPKKHGRLSHHPQIAFLGRGYIVNLWNRSGNSSSGNGIVEFFRQTIRSLGGGKIGVTRVLSDTGYYMIDFIDHLERNGYLYIISAPMNQMLQRRIFDIKDWSNYFWRRLRKPHWRISAQSKILSNVSPNHSGAGTFPSWRQIRNPSEKSRSDSVRHEQAVAKLIRHIPRRK